jgi:T4 RnlA family RNA ligase
MKIDIEIINKYVNEGLVEKNSHPTFPIAIYNYSRETQFEGKWDDITKRCRGLVLDNDGNIIAKGFDKFFNMEEHSLSEIPDETFEVFEKMDGSLGILFWYQGNWIFASKGSFTSEQAMRGREILSKYDIQPLPKGYTTLVEIIYPENRIVCDYGDEESLVALSMISNVSGKEFDYSSMVQVCEVVGFPVVKRYDGIKDYYDLKETIDNDKEGFVIRFRSGFRMKIKGEEYVRLHRILTGFSNINIWETLKDGKDINEFLEKVPDEFDKWVKNVVKDLRYSYFQISESAGKLYDGHMYGKYNDKEPVTDRKEFAEWVHSQDYFLQPILFKMFDKKDYSIYIWNLIRPIYSKPFWQKRSES